MCIKNILVLDFDISLCKTKMWTWLWGEQTEFGQHKCELREKLMSEMHGKLSVIWADMWMQSKGKITAEMGGGQ